MEREAREWRELQARQETQAPREQLEQQEREREHQEEQQRKSGKSSKSIQPASHHERVRPRSGATRPRLGVESWKRFARLLAVSLRALPKRFSSDLRS